MSQPVKLSDALVLDARLAGEAQERSIAGQVEFWARLGRCVEEHLGGRELRTLRQTARQRSLSELVEAVDKPEGRARLKAYLDSEPFPHFEPHPARKGWLVRIDEDGRRTAGRFVNRQFVVDGGDVDRPNEIPAARNVASPELERWKRSEPMENEAGGRRSEAGSVLSGAPGSLKGRTRLRTSKSDRA